MRLTASLMSLLLVTPVAADISEEDAAFFEFLGSFEAEDDEWLDSLLSEPTDAEDPAQQSAEVEEDQ